MKSLNITSSNSFNFISRSNAYGAPAFGKVAEGGELATDEDEQGVGVE
jgi:hypothetical protein